METEENNNITNKEIPNQKPRRRVKRLNPNFFAHFLICLICVSVFAIVCYRGEILKSVQKMGDHGYDAKDRWELKLPLMSRRQNILLMGVDVSENPNRPFDNTRSDSIYIVSIAPYAKDVNVISIPRDSKVYIHSKSSPDKINHAFAIGGISTSQKTIEHTLGIKIDHYLVVSNSALIDFIDKLGGVDVYVEKDMHYNDNTANLHINLQKGVQHLNGVESEGYLRYRKDALGDIGRIRRQQWFLNAVGTKMKDPSVIIKMPEIIKSVLNYVQTDLNVYELAQYAALVKSMDMSKVKVATLPGEPSQRGFISYWILDPEGVQELVDKLIYGDKPKKMDRNLEVGILYVPSEEQTALELQKELESQGVSVNSKQVKYLGHDHIAIHNFDIPSDAIARLKGTISILKDKQTVYDIIGINKAARDFTVVLAGS